LSVFEPTVRSQLKRAPARGSHDLADVHAVLDAAPMCHVGYVIDGQPYVTPTFHWRDGERVFWHGSSASRMLRTVKQGVKVCLTAALFDGYVLARSPFHHSANYRSVMAFGTASAIEDAAEKEAALKIMMEKLWPGRWEELRANQDKEIRSTTVVAMEIEEASAKVRTGPPVDDEEDYAIPVWAGELPLAQGFGAPVPDPRMLDGIELPAYLK
jgi:nitroimidazol reductase NimA-like FMN-containing flavoprotein (pyridoxamine 5'-phosphate oxidase superfamily)